MARGYIYISIYIIVTGGFGCKMPSCKILTNYSPRKDNTCSRYSICLADGRTKDPRCIAKGSTGGRPYGHYMKTRKGGVVLMDDAERDELKKVEVDEEQVVSLLKAGKTIWETAEEVYGVEFDHSDRKTWLFYSKINAIRKKHELPAPKKPKPEPEEEKEEVAEPEEE